MPGVQAGSQEPQSVRWIIPNKKAAAASAGRPRALAAFILRPQAVTQIGAKTH